jgi:hypothetical protein
MCTLKQCGKLILIILFLGSISVGGLVFLLVKTTDPPIQPIPLSFEWVDKIDISKPYNFTVLGWGSRGDIQPFINLGKELKSRGIIILSAS